MHSLSLSLSTLHSLTLSFYTALAYSLSFSLAFWLSLRYPMGLAVNHKNHIIVADYGTFACLFASSY